jgi:hypothetical protein
MAPAALVEDYPPSDDDKDTTVQTPPPHSPSFFSPPIQEYDMDDVSDGASDGAHRARHLPDTTPLALPPISGPSSKGLTLPPVCVNWLLLFALSALNSHLARRQHLIAEAHCRECEDERSRRTFWDDEHGRLHLENTFPPVQRRSSSPRTYAHAHARPHAVSLDARRHTVHGPLATHPRYYYPYPPLASYSRQRYPFQAPFPAPRRAPMLEPLYDYDERYAHKAPYACALPPRHPSINFDGFTLSPRQPPALEPIIDPRDASFSAAPDERRSSCVLNLFFSTRCTSDTPS